MPYLAESATSASGWAAIDFMRRAYELNGEPLRLLVTGQPWFGSVLSHEYSPRAAHSGLVLGATPWLSDLVQRTVEHTIVADTSAAMLALCADTVTTNPAVEFLHCNWLVLPSRIRDLHLVAGDNSFSFLRYPDEWDRMLDILSERMADGAVLLARFLSVPANHRRLRPAEIVKNAIAQRTAVNFTAIRVALLFAHWNSEGYAIHPEEALATFEEQRSQFDPLFSDMRGPRENDLLSIEKYRGTGAVYFVPPLAEALERFERRFHVTAVYFGPYQMSQYFPLIAAAKRPA